MEVNVGADIHLVVPRSWECKSQPCIYGMGRITLYCPCSLQSLLSHQPLAGIRRKQGHEKIIHGAEKSVSSVWTAAPIGYLAGEQMPPEGPNSSEGDLEPPKENAI